MNLLVLNKGLLLTNQKRSTAVCFIHAIAVFLIWSASINKLRYLDMTFAKSLNILAGCIKRQNEIIRTLNVRLSDCFVDY